MDEENMIHIYDRTLFSFKKQGNPTICDNMNEPAGHYAK